jgi:hypothetical protein
MCFVKSPKIPSITTDFVNRMMTADDCVDDDQSIIRSSYCLPVILVYHLKKDLRLLNEEQTNKQTNKHM